VKSDFEMIGVKYPREQERVNLYPLGDLHKGSQHFSEIAWRRWVDMVVRDPYAAVVIIGDMVENVTKKSKGSVYEQTMRPPW